ncbi:MAG TPA: hypothetical protein PLO23_02395 [Alphaproteobacteria bacterium]|nr:hypothetical protein [Alphaproteobacteria bacterium]
MRYRYLLLAGACFMIAPGVAVAQTQYDGYGTAEQMESDMDQQLAVEEELEALMSEEQDLIAALEEQIAAMKDAEDQATATAILSKIKQQESPFKRKRMLNKLSRILSYPDEKQGRAFASIRERQRERTQGGGNNSGVSAIARAGVRDNQVACGATGGPSDFSSAAAAMAGDSTSNSGTSGTGSNSATDTDPWGNNDDDTETGQNGFSNSDDTAAEEDNDVERTPEDDALMKALCDDVGGTFVPSTGKCKFSQAQADKINKDTGEQGGGGGGGGSGLKDLLKNLKPEDMMKMMEVFKNALGVSQKGCIVNAGKKPVNGKSSVQDCVDQIGGMK